MKKLFLFLMALLPLVANADAVVIDGIYYNLNEANHTAEVTFKPIELYSGYFGPDADYYSGNITIPASVTYNSMTYSVISIGENAFSSSNIESVHLPEGISTIEDVAFFWCVSLKTINIPSTVTRIGRDNFSEPSDGPFKMCSSLTTLRIPASVTTFGPQSLAISEETTVILESSTPPSLQDDYVILDALGFSFIKKIVVPNGSKSAYQSANVWKKVKDLIYEMDEVYGTPDPITVTAKSYSRVYGDANPSFGYDVSGGSLSGTPSITCSATATSPVGEYDIVVTQGSVTNGSVTYVNGKLTITKAPLNISAGSYSMKQGEALPTFSASYSGFKNGETEDVLTTRPTLSTSATSSSGPGNYEVVVSGASAPNYDISYTNGSLTISAPDPITVTAMSYSRVYGDANPSFGYDVSGGTLSGTPSITCEATATSPVGEYDIVVAQGSVTNGSVTYVKGKLTITKAPLNISAGTYSMKQGEALPTFSASYSGFKNGETEDVLTTKPTLSTTATSSSAPGTYDVVASGASAQNYEINYTNGTLTITATTTEAITITAKSYSRVYGDANPSFGYDVSGGTLSGTPSITSSATSTSPVGEYDIVVAQGSVTNGNVTYVKGKLTITKAPLNISAGSYSMKQGESLPTFSASYSGFKNGETEDVLTTKPTLSTSATSSSAPGTYDVVVSGAAAQNYEISYTNGTLTITATTTEAITITAKSYSRVYGDANPSFGYDVIGGTLSGTPSVTCSATSTSPVGEYDIVVAQGSVTNGNVTYVKGKLTITKAPLNISAGTYSMKQGEALPTFSASYSGFKNGETEDVLTTKPTLSTTATSSSAPGTYDVVASGASAQNYEINYTNGTLTITATTTEAITITAKSYSRVYGDANPSFGYDVSGGTLSGTPSITCEATATSPVGEYDIIVSQGSVSNSNVTYVKGKLTITKAPLTISAGTYSMKQGESLPTFKASYSGFKNNETEDVLTTKPTISTSATSSSQPGTYDVNVSGASAQNYEISYTNGTLTITASSPSGAVLIDGIYYNLNNGNHTAEVTFKPVKFDSGYIGYDAGYYSGNLTIPASVTYNSTTYSVTSIGECAFAESSIGSVQLPVGLLAIEDAAFSLCTSLREINIPSTVTRIGRNNFSEPSDGPFKMCSSLTTLRIPASVTTFGPQSLAISEETTVILESSTPPSLQDDYVILDALGFSFIKKIVVPNGSKSAYQSANVWKKVKDLIYEMDEVYGSSDPITITAKSYSRVYGDSNPSFGYDVTGGSLSGTPSITCEATATSPVGEYDIIVSQGSVSNSNVTYVKGKLTITKAPLTISAGTYSMKQGESLPTFKASYSGFKNNETEDVLTTKPTISTSATSSSQPGTYDVNVSGASAQNYEISYTNGTLTITANNTESYTVTAKSYSRVYGDSNPSFGYDVTGGSLSGTPSITCEATATSPVGEYDIIVSQGSVSNSNVTYVKGKLTITKAPLTISAGTYSMKQGESLPTFKASYSGFKNNETEDVLTTKPTISTSATSSSQPGTYDVNVSGASAQNYEISYIKGVLIITEADQGDVKILPPIEDGTTLNTSTLSGQDLTNNVVEGVYYNLGSEGYDSNDQSLVLGQITNMSAVSDKTPGSTDVKNNFHGMIMAVNGKGVIKVRTQSFGSAKLAIMIGNSTPVIEAHTIQEDMNVEYNLSSSTNIYFYAVGSANSSTRSTSSDIVKIYSITIIPNTTDIKALNANVDSNSIWYTLDGRRLNVKPTKNGIYIMNGKKILIK